MERERVQHPHPGTDVRKNTQARQIMEREFNTLIQVQMLGRTPRPGRSWRERVQHPHPGTSVRKNTQPRQIMEREFNTLIQVKVLGRTPRPDRSWRESSTPSSRYKC